MIENVSVPNSDNKKIQYELFALILKHTDKLPIIEVLAVVSNLVGKLSAFQENAVGTKDQILDVIIKNMEIGRSETLDTLKPQKDVGGQ